MHGHLWMNWIVTQGVQWLSSISRNEPNTCGFLEEVKAWARCMFYVLMRVTKFDCISYLGSEYTSC